MQLLFTVCVLLGIVLRAGALCVDTSELLEPLRDLSGLSTATISYEESLNNIQTKASFDEALSLSQESIMMHSLHGARKLTRHYARSLLDGDAVI